MSYNRTTAKEIMTTELIVGNENITVEEAIRTLVNNKITGMPIVDKERKLIGVLSEYDIIKRVKEENEENLVDLNKTIKFTQKITTINEDTKLSEILHLFVEKKLRRLPVVNTSGQLVGIISRKDIMKLLYYRSKSI